MVDELLPLAHELGRLGLAVWLTDSEGVTLWASQAFESMTGLGSLLGRSRAEVLARPGNTAARMLEVPAGSGARLVLALNEGAARVSRERDEMLSVVSHELRTPLGTMRFQLRLAEEALPREAAEVRDALEVVSRQLDRLDRLVGNLVTAVRMETDRRDPRLPRSAPPLDLARFATMLVHGFEAEATAEGVSLEVDAPLSVVGAWAQDDVECLLGNLVLNAIRHSGGSRVLVSVRPAPDGGADVEVRDWGVGIDAADHARIFLAFERGVSRRGGAGLGLWIARRAGERLGGSVSVASEPGRGATFRARLPERVRSSVGPG